MKSNLTQSNPSLLHSELQQVWSVTVLQRERSSQVLLQQRSLLDLHQQSLVNDLLVLDSLSLQLSNLLLWEQVSLSLLLLSQLVVSSEVLDVELRNIDGLDGDSSRSSDDVTGIDSSEWDTVDLEWTRDQQSVVLQVLQVNDPLASETTS